MSWTDERVEMLKKLWADGLSASQIAFELGDISRNAVIGKVTRLGLTGRKKISTSTKVTERKSVKITNLDTINQKRAGTLKSAPLPKEQPILLPPLKLELFELTEHTCRWPIGDPAQEDFHFCGHQCPIEIPYCTAHMRIAYVPVVDRRGRRPA